MTQAELEEIFSKLSNDDYIEFERIPPEEKRHVRPDICALLYMHERFGGPERDAISNAEHDQISLDWDCSEYSDEGKALLAKITEADVLYLTRCGVRFEGSYFRMSV